MSPPRSKNTCKAPASPVDKLVDRATKGDREAFDRLQALYKDRIYNYAARMIHDPIEAEDIAQEAFVKAYRSIHGFRGNSTFQTWLYRIAFNLTIDAVRRRQRMENTCSLDSPLDTDEGQMGREQEDTHGPDPAQSLETAETQRAVHVVIRQLSPKLRTVIILCDLQGLRYDEIAERLRIPLGTVKSRLYNARLELSRMFVEAGLVDESARSRYVAALDRSDPSVSYFGRIAPRRRQEGAEMSEFRDRIRKIRDDLILRVIKSGYDIADLQGNETVEEYLHRRAEDLVESMRHQEEDGSTELSELAKGLDLDLHELTSYLRGIMIEKKDERIKEANFAFEIVPFVDQMDELVESNCYECEGTVAQYLGERVIDWNDKNWEAIQECAGDYTVPEPAALMVGLDYLDRTYGEMPTVKLVGEDYQIYCAFMDSEQAFKLKEALDARFSVPSPEEEYGLPDESEVDFDLEAFLTILVEPADDYGFKEAPFVWESLACMALEIDPASDAIERFAAVAKRLEFPRPWLLMAGFAYLSRTMDGEPSIELPERERDLYNKFLARRNALELEERLKSLPIPSSQPIVPVPPTPEPVIPTPIVPVPAPSPQQAEVPGDPSMPTSLTPGVFPSGVRGSWKQPVYTYLGGTHPFFDSASAEETAEQWAPRVYAKGASCSVIAYILGGLGMTPEAVEMKFKNLRERHDLVIAVGEADTARFAYLDELVPKRPKPDKRHKKGEPKPSKYPLGPVVFFVKGVGWGRIGWDKPSTGTVLDRNPEFLPILGETRSDYAVRLFKQGYEARIIAYLLGVENSSVTAELSKRRKSDATVTHTLEQRQSRHYLFAILDKIESGEPIEAPLGTPNAPVADPLELAKEELNERLRTNAYMEANAAFYSLAVRRGVYYLPQRSTVLEMLACIHGILVPEDLKAELVGLCSEVGLSIELLLPIVQQLEPIRRGPEGDELDMRNILDIWRWEIWDMPIIRAGMEASVSQRLTLLEYGRHLKREGVEDKKIFNIICGGSPLNEGQVAAKLSLPMPDITPPPPPITPPITPTPPPRPTQDPTEPSPAERTVTKMNQALIRLIGQADPAAVEDALASIGSGLPSGAKLTPGILADIISQCELTKQPVKLD